MIKRITAALVLVLAAAAVLRADWKSELNSRLGPDRDYRGAWLLLNGALPTLPAEDKQAAAFILPYLAARCGELKAEKDLSADYFETYQDNDPDLGFLNAGPLYELLAFWARWKRSYPLVSGVTLLSYSRTPATGLPASVDIGLDLLNEALYRISLGPYVLEGGQWSKGFHILTIPLSGLFNRSDTYEFILDLKAGDVICRRPIRLRIEIADVGPAPVARREDFLAAPPRVPLRPIREGEISLYIDGRLVLKSRKIAARASSFSFPLGGPLLPGQKPYMPPPRTDPIMSGVNILDALALAYKTIKDMVAKKPPKPAAPSYQKVSSLSFAYSRTISADQTVSARASISLPPSRAVILDEE
ncbi:MAG TPA: hypothetical protein P5119_08465 [Candidatus Aminicenantes bacterium]|nr:hypothetical protein [Candidatus Aminicenantes bacterium]HRY65360.1 hypothetical protein [Candidatus Aminicenantes bacterium]HRZ72172.1 hypothetical protein [Candidatus Aminicenantes bacterium]